VRLCEHRHSLKEGLLEKSKLAQHAYEERHRVSWDEARSLEIESNSRYRKHKESAHMACLINPTTANPVWTYLPPGSPLSAMRLSTHRDQYDVIDSSVILSSLYTSFKTVEQMGDKTQVNMI
jgi:hypothetical protein